MKNLMLLTFCFLLQVVILMISLPTTHCRRSFQSIDETLIENTCKKTQNYILCLQCLKSDPDSSSAADVTGLALIMVDVTYAKAKDAIDKIEQLQAGGGGTQKEALDSCYLKYAEILAIGLPEATEALQKGYNPMSAENVVDESANFATLCEKGFSGKSPITKENNDMHDVATITTAIIKLLL